MKRHNARILTVMVLYNLDMNQYLNDEIVTETVNETKQEVFDLILDEEYKVEVDYEFLEKLLNITITNYSKIKDIVISSLTSWTIDRLSYVDRAILIVSTGEMLLNDAPKQVVINEYLEITKEYTAVADEKQVKFNNKVMDAIANKIYE